MVRKFYYMISIFCIILFSSTIESVYAYPKNTPPSIEETFEQAGYKSVDEAVKEFENHFKRNVKLPKVNPSIPFTHQFGRFYEDKEYDVNDYLSISFVNEKLSENHYKIDIRPIENKLTFEDKGNQQVYTLQNGQKSIYMTDNKIFCFLIFETDDWQYMLGIDKKISNKVTPEVLVRIANSIE